MATLHTALQSLSPTSFTSVPKDQSGVTAYLHKVFRDAQTIIDSVPLPPPDDPIIAAQASARTRSSTSTSSASNVSEISSSSARSDPINPSNASLQKEWGKPIKLNAKDNPLGMAVYRLAGKDGKGAWFARRSVHEGLGFRRWKAGLQREFPETLEVQGGPGEGNIRGIGGERRVEKMDVDGMGNVEVYHLSAQFPGPTTPRDFVTLLLTSSFALSEPQAVAGAVEKEKADDLRETPRHFMVVSRPCQHSECPPRDGFIRGQYESVEFIREIPRSKPRNSVSVTDLTERKRDSFARDKASILKNGEITMQGNSEDLLFQKKQSPVGIESGLRDGRQRGKTISFAGSRGASAKGERLDTPQTDDEDESNPVEWTMITRSDPGGSVPRFMVERGTPGSIVADASKFLDWACKRGDFGEKEKAIGRGDDQPPKSDERDGLVAYSTNGHLAGLDNVAGTLAQTNTPPTEKEPAVQDEKLVLENQSGGLMTSVANVAYSSLENYAPQAIVNRLPSHQQHPSVSSVAVTNKDAATPDDLVSAERTPSASSMTSVGSFASAEDHFDDAKSVDSRGKSITSKDDMTPHEKELAKLIERKKQLNEKLAKAREKETKDKEELTLKEEERVRKAEEKHAREIAKQEDRYKKEIGKLEAKRQKEAAKDLERKKKVADKDEKMRLTREKEAIKEELEMVSKERDILKEQVGALQKENTSLVVKMGKMESGKDVLRELKAELNGSPSRSRSSSVMKGEQMEVEGSAQ